MAITSVKIGQQPGNFGMFLNYIGFLYTWKKFHCIVNRSFYRALQKFQCINIFCSFCMTQIVTKFWYVFKFYRSDSHTKISHCIGHRSFYRALQKFQCINIFCSFLMSVIGTKFWCYFKLHRSDLHIKISHCFQYILFHRALQEFEYIYCSFLMTQIGTKCCF